MSGDHLIDVLDWWMPMRVTNPPILPALCRAVHIAFDSIHAYLHLTRRIETSWRQRLLNDARQLISLATCLRASHRLLRQGRRRICTLYGLLLREQRAMPKRLPRLTQTRQHFDMP